MDDDDALRALLAEFGIFVPPVEGDAEDDDLPPRLDDLDWDGLE